MPAFVPARRALVVGALSVLPLFAACSGITDTRPDVNRYGAINITGRTQSATRASAQATVIFFEAFTVALPSSALQQTDQCIPAGVDSLFVEPRGQQRAGSTVSLAAGTAALSLAYSDAFARYATPVNTPFQYAAGDVAQLGIPGDPATFPASNISVKLAEPIVPGPVTLPGSGQPLSVTWNATNDASAAIIVSLKYAATAGATRANAQIYCAARDDGQFDVPAAFLPAFLTASPALRTLQITRWRTNEQVIDPRTVLHIASSVDTIVTVP